MTFEKKDFQKEALIKMLRREKAGAISSFVELFKQSNIKVAEVKDYKHKDNHSCTCSIQSYLRKNNIKDIEARTVNGKVYIFNLKLIGDIK